MEAFLYKKLDGLQVQCHLCCHRCVINDGRRGKCGVRENRSGVLETLVYNRLIARHVDPIEKKPLFHVSPGSLSYSIAALGCNFKCLFCQNADIAQELVKSMPVDIKGLTAGNLCSPREVVEAAVKNNCRSIAYTYTEPTVYFEFAFETATLAKEKRLKNVFVTNGFMTPEALEMVAPVLDAANVDLKAFNEHFYKDICGADLEHVKKTLKKMKSLGVFIEVTTLLIPGLNDEKKELENLALFLAEDIGTETPWHISRFHPTYKLTDRPSTPVESLETARDIGIDAGLKYVYIGNVPGDSGENTICYSCGRTLIERWGFTVRENLVKKGACSFCGAVIHGIDM